jgi:hypothetical protein
MEQMLLVKMGNLAAFVDSNTGISLPKQNITCRNWFQNQVSDRFLEMEVAIGCNHLIFGTNLQKKAWSEFPVRLDLYSNAKLCPWTTI